VAASAPVYSIADEHRSHTEAAAWARFVAAEGTDEFHAGWLSLLASRIAHARAALLLVADDQGQAFGVAATWPDARHDLKYLGPVAQRALSERAGVVVGPDGGEPEPDGGAHVGYPIEVAGKLCAAVVVDIAETARADLQAALRQIHWASAWLVDHFRRLMLAEREATLARVDLLNDLLATALQHGRLEPSAMAVANRLAQRLQCDRVSVGFEHAGRVKPLVLSHTATFDARADLVRWIGDAMDEVLDLGVAVRHPVVAADELGAIVHGESARELRVEAICSVPLLHEGQTIGAMTLERTGGPAFDDSTLSLARAAGELLGPVWVLQRERDRPWWQRLREHARSAAQAIAGPQHPGIKLLSSAAALFVAVISFWFIDYRISARTVVEGSQQIAAVAPFEGFVAEAMARAGDTVRQGQPLARLDDRDLKLESARWSAEREQLMRRFQVAQAAQDRGAMGVVSAQIGQAEAQLALVQERLARATLVAPYDGVVVSGDLSQQIGSPVEQGKVLFEVAPAQGYRIILQVDERDIARLEVGQRGELVLSGLPGEPQPFTVRQITPVSTAQDGRNFFRVEAQLDATAPPRLRPGMEGVGKVLVGRERLIWIWTHGFTDWWRLALWTWMP
jgi:multidrug resistance efflux pump